MKEKNVIKQEKTAVQSAKKQCDAAKCRATPGRFLAGIAVVILAAYLFLFFGPNRTAVQIETPTDALKGFTLTGQAGDSFYATQFTLRDGEVKNRFTPGAVQGYGRIEPPFTSGNLVVSPAEHAAVDRRAKQNASMPQIWNSTCVEFVCAITVNTGSGSARIVPDVVYRAPNQVSIQASLFKDPFGRYRVNDYYNAADYMAVGSLDIPRAGAAVIGEDTYVFVGGINNTADALYRVDATLSEKQVQALPKDGAVQGVPVRLAGTPYGTVTQMRQFPIGTTIYAMSSVGDSLCLGVKEDGKYKLHLLNKQGEITDTFIADVEVATAENERFGDPLFQTFTAQNPGEICFSIQFRAADSVEQNVYCAGLRVKDGKIIAACNTGILGNYYWTKQGITSTSVSSVTLRDDNQALLVMRPLEEYSNKRTNSQMWQYLPNGLRLEVFEQDGVEPTATSTLGCNQKDDWNAHNTGFSTAWSTLDSSIRRIYVNGQAGGFIYFRF